MVHNTPTTARMARVVAAALEQSDISNRQAADLSAIPRTTLERRMRTGDFTVAELVSIAQILGTTVSALTTLAEQDVA